MTTVADCWKHYAASNLDLSFSPHVNKRYWGRLLWFAGHKVEDLTPMEVDRYIAHRSPRSPATVNRELNLLRACLKSAQRAGLVTAVPKIRSVGGATPRLRSLTMLEAKQMVTAADHRGMWREQVYIRLALGTGARPEAIIGLKWDQVDEANSVIDFRLDGEPKAARMKKRAVVPINATVRAALKLAKQHQQGPYVIQLKGKRLCHPRLIVIRLAKEAGIDDVSPHVLRHTVASLLIQQGVDLLKVSKLLGHANSQITERVYFQHPPSWLKDATKLLAF